MSERVPNESFDTFPAWLAVGAALKDSTGMDVVLSPWQGVAIAPGAYGSVAIEVKKKSQQLDCPCTLSLWDAHGSRTVMLDVITFLFGQEARH